MEKWYLIYSYHDMHFIEFNVKWELEEYLEDLKKEYYHSPDLHWKVIKGVEIND